MGLNAFQELIKELDGRVQVYTQLPTSLRGVSLEHLQGGYPNGDYIWYAATDLSGKPLYLAGKSEHLSRSERYLLRMAIRAIPLSSYDGQNWEQKIAEALHEPLEPYGSAIRIDSRITCGNRYCTFFSSSAGMDFRGNCSDAGNSPR